MDDQAQMRKVELGSPEDMRYIIKSIQAAAKKKTDLHIPPVQAEGDDDLLRKRVEELVDDYVRKTFALSAPNISINALACDPDPTGSYLAPRPPTESFEAYDRQLHSELVELQGKIERRTLEIAQLRKEQPGKLAEVFAVAVEKEGKDDEKREAMLGGVKREREGVVRGGRCGGGKAERLEEVVGSRERAESGLAELKEGLPRVASKLTRAREAAGFVVEREERERGMNAGVGVGAGTGER